MAKTWTDPNRKPAIACGALLAAAIVLAFVGRHERTAPVIDPANVRQELALKFTDAPDGSVVAIDATNGAELERIAPGAGGFIRVTMRSFAMERKQHGMGADVPFQLTRMRDGDLVLTDPLTNRRMLLNAFGPANEGVFAQLLDDRRTTE